MKTTLESYSNENFDRQTSLALELADRQRRCKLSFAPQYGYSKQTWDLAGKILAGEEVEACDCCGTQVAVGRNCTTCDPITGDDDEIYRNSEPCGWCDCISCECGIDG